MTTDIIGENRFDLGQIFVTPGVTELIDKGLLLDLYLDRHWRGDWGNIDSEEKQTNEGAILHGDRILFGSLNFDRIMKALALVNITGNANAELDIAGAVAEQRRLDLELR